MTRIPPATEAKTSTACIGRPAWRGQHGQRHHQATAVESHDGPLGLGLAHGGHQGLQLHHQGASTLEGGKHHPTRYPRQPVTEQEPARVVDPVEALVAHLEQTELTGRARSGA